MGISGRRLSGVLLAAAIALPAVGPAVAQDSSAQSGFDPREPCAKVLERDDVLGKVMLASWVYGYLAAAQGAQRPVDTANIRVMLRNISKACATNGERSVLSLVQASRPAPASQPGSQANARAMLERFLAPDADIAALSQALFPTEADVRALYRDPLASTIVRDLLPRFKPGVRFSPKPGQDSLIVVHATTDQLIDGDAVLRDFPGGYKEVLSYMNRGIPIVRFKFVENGKTTGLAFDGLVFVNGRWVLIPKPWRYLD